jgi:hypothetical protein
MGVEKGVIIRIGNCSQAKGGKNLKALLQRALQL